MNAVEEAALVAEVQAPIADGSLEAAEARMTVGLVTDPGAVALLGIHAHVATKLEHAEDARERLALIRQLPPNAA
jgi:hypothetical protein